MRLEQMDAVVLAGGLGTRLQGVLGDSPKILAPVAGRPFLEWLLAWLKREGICRVVLSLGHRSGAVLDYLDQRTPTGVEVVPVVEPRPLGTAGALAFLRPWLKSDPVAVINGDTMVEVELSSFAAEHRRRLPAISMVCVQVPDPGRYGQVEIDESGAVISFSEKTPASQPGWINGGIYLFGREMLASLGEAQPGSLEQDILARMPPGSIHAFCAKGTFLDIGTPQSLAAAGDFVSHWLPGLEPQ